MFLIHHVRLCSRHRARDPVLAAGGPAERPPGARAREAECGQEVSGVPWCVLAVTRCVQQDDGGGGRHQQPAQGGHQDRHQREPQPEQEALEPGQTGAGEPAAVLAGGRRAGRGGGGRGGQRGGGAALRHGHQRPAHLHRAQEGAAVRQIPKKSPRQPAVSLFTVFTTTSRLVENKIHGTISSF